MSSRPALQPSLRTTSSSIIGLKLLFLWFQVQHQGQYFPTGFTRCYCAARNSNQYNSSDINSETKERWSGWHWWTFFCQEFPMLIELRVFQLNHNRIARNQTYIFPLVFFLEKRPNLRIIRPHIRVLLFFSKDLEIGFTLRLSPKHRVILLWGEAKPVLLFNLCILKFLRS